MSLFATSVPTSTGSIAFPDDGSYTCGALCLGFLTGLPPTVILFFWGLWAYLWLRSSRLPSSLTRLDSLDLSLTSTQTPVRWLNLRVQHLVRTHQPVDAALSEPFILRVDNLTRRMEAHSSDAAGAFSLLGTFVLVHPAYGGHFRLRKAYEDSCGGSWAQLDGVIAVDARGWAALKGTWATGDRRLQGEFSFEVLDLGEGERLSVVGRQPQPPPPVERPGPPPVEAVVEAERLEMGEVLPPAYDEAAGMDEEQRDPPGYGAQVVPGVVPRPAVFGQLPAGEDELQHEVEVEGMQEEGVEHP